MQQLFICAKTAMNQQMLRGWGWWRSSNFRVQWWTFNLITVKCANTGHSVWRLWPKNFWEAFWELQNALTDSLTEYLCTGGGVFFLVKWRLAVANVFVAAYVSNFLCCRVLCARNIYLWPCVCAPFQTFHCSFLSCWQIADISNTITNFWI